MSVGIAGGLRRYVGIMVILAGMSSDPATAAGQTATSFTVAVECAPGGGRFESFELTVGTGLSKDESHDQTSFSQRRFQAAGRPGIHRRRDAAWIITAARYLPATDPDLGRQVRSGCA